VMTVFHLHRFVTNNTIHTRKF